MRKQYTYYSVLCSNYMTLFGVLMKHRIPFEWHSKVRGCGRCYADFTLDRDYNPALWEIEDEAKAAEAGRGKKFDLKVISTYEY